MAYTVSKLTDYSAAALEKAAAGCVRACVDEAAAVRSDAELKTFRDRWLARKNGILTQIGSFAVEPGGPTPTPEPMRLLLAGTGILGIVFARKFMGRYKSC